MKTAIVVLGMHRSGTSSVAGTMALLGAASPKTLMAPASDNPKGFWESDVVMRLNDSMLAERGLTWSDWRHACPAVSAGDAMRIAEVMQDEFGEANLVVLKDPRMCRLFQAWRQGLAQANYRMVTVSPVRRPSEVVASLMARNPLSSGQAFRLWLSHVLDAEAASRGLPRHFMTWADFMTDWRSEIATMTRRVGVTLDLSKDRSAAVDDFLSQELHRQRSDEQGPALVRHTWETLQQIARFGDHPDLLSRLDALRSEFARACALFSDVNVTAG
jgi:hypothetical protein